MILTQELIKIPFGINEKNSCDTFSKLNNQAKSNKIMPQNNKTLVYLFKFPPEIRNNIRSNRNNTNNSNRNNSTNNSKHKIPNVIP
jgi:hypothetical protein